MARMRHFITALAMATLTTQVGAEGQFRWHKFGWAEPLCAKEKESLKEICLRRIGLNYYYKFQNLSQSGKSWVTRACHTSIFDVDGINACAYRQIEALTLPGWPDTDKAPQETQLRVTKKCAQSTLSPAEWRACAEAELRPSQPNGWTSSVQRAAVDVPTPHEYAEHVGNGATVVEPGRLKLAGQPQICGQRPTVMDPTLDDHAAAYPGFIIINPTRIATLEPVVQFWIYAQGCGFQFRGPDPTVADCYATERGIRQGWLASAGVDEICKLFSTTKGDDMHLPGPERCDAIRKCYANALAASTSAQDDISTSGLPALDALPRPPMPMKIVDREMTPQEIYRSVSPSVYLVIAGSSVRSITDGEAVLGSAVAVSAHDAITNCHVVKDQGIVALFDADTQKVSIATISVADDETDRCFLSVTDTLKPIAGVRPAADLKVGERVYTIGNPSGLTKTMGEGIISGLRQRDVLLIQTTAPISHGSSGGALVDSTGALVGVTTAFLKDSQNINFAIAGTDFWK